MTRPSRSARRAVTLYALYVLLTTVFAVLVVQVGMHRVGGREPAEQAIELGSSDDRLPVRTVTPAPSPKPATAPAMPAAPPRDREDTAKPSAKPTTNPPLPRKPPAPAPAKPGGPTTRPGAPTTAAPSSHTFFLKTVGSGNRNSTPTLPLSTARPTRSTVPNYDTDRDDGPGLRVGKGGSGPAERDPRKIQAWAYAVPRATQLKGSAKVTLWYALEQFSAKGRATLTVTLQDCAGGSCVTLGTGRVLRTSWTGGWQGSTFTLGTLNRTVAAGHTLRLTVVTDKDCWLAYDTTATPSALRIG